nr:hypothetical protein [uncultured Flavobacterium sp.]
MKQMDPLSIAALILIALGSCGGIILTIAQFKSSSAENLALRNDLTEIKRERVVLSETLALRDANITEQNKNIHDLSLKLAEKSEYIQNYLTGGKGYLFLDMRKLSEKGTYDNFMFQLDNKFDLPLYNIQCDIFDYDIIKNKSYHKNNSTQHSIKLNDYKSARILSEEFSEIGAKRFITIDRIFPVKDCIYYANIRARNQTVIAKLTILIVGNGDYFGFQIVDQKGKILEEDINKLMPKEISDKIRRRLNSIPNNLSLTLENN